MSSDLPVFSLSDVHFAYDGNEALRGVSLEIAAGESVSLIGPNGSGKTTLLRLMSGVLKPTQGEVWIMGMPAGRLGRREIAQRIAVVPQETGIIFPFTVEEVVLMGRFPHLGAYGFESAHDMAAAHEAMRVTETLSFAKRPIQELSGGERQRVIIARALSQEPAVLLLDEPTAFLDMKHQVEITTLVNQLRVEKNLTVVASSHDLNLATAFADRLVLLKEGRLFKEGPAHEVIDEGILCQAYETAVRVREWEGTRFVAARFAPEGREK